MPADDLVPVSVYYQARLPVLRGYRPGDVLILVARGSVPSDRFDPAAICEALFAGLNADGRPWGDRLRSMSMGDVVALGGVAYSCETLGFVPVDLRVEDCYEQGPFAPMSLELLKPTA